MSLPSRVEAPLDSAPVRLVVARLATSPTSTRATRASSSTLPSTQSWLASSRTSSPRSERLTATLQSLSMYGAACVGACAAALTWRRRCARWRVQGTLFRFALRTPEQAASSRLSTRAHSVESMRALLAVRACVAKPGTGATAAGVCSSVRDRHTRHSRVAPGVRARSCVDAPLPQVCRVH